MKCYGEFCIQRRQSDRGWSWKSPLERKTCFYSFRWLSMIFIKMLLLTGRLVVTFLCRGTPELPECNPPIYVSPYSQGGPGEGEHGDGARLLAAIGHKLVCGHDHGSLRNSATKKLDYQISLIFIAFSYFKWINNIITQNSDFCLPRSGQAYESQTLLPSSRRHLCTEGTSIEIWPNWSNAKLLGMKI